MPIYTYEHALTYLSSLEKKGIFLNVDSTHETLKCFNNPHLKFKSILVAGTNGKGSTVAMLSSILRQADYKVGTYISPHLLDIRERIQLNGNKIAKGDFVQLINEVDKKLKSTSIRLSFFELMTVIAFLYFERQKVDFAVVEVGLGGRLDATNVLNPLISVITSIQLDHQRLLGNTLTKIAYEKAGIIKKNRSVVSGAAQPKIQKLLSRITQKNKSKFYQLEKDFFVQGDKQEFQFSMFGEELKHLSLSLSGKFHQRRNAACVLAALQILKQSGWKISEQAIRQGLKKTLWPGRLELVQKHPQVLLDGAHNPDGIRVLMRALKNDYQYEKLHFVFGVMADKNYKEMLKLIMPHAHSLSFVEPEVKRALKAEELLKTMSHSKYKIQIQKDLSSTLPKVIARAHPQDVVCVTGSLYMVAEAKRFFAS